MTALLARSDRTRTAPAGHRRDDVVAVLAASPLFEGIGPAELQVAALELEEQHYLAGHRIVTEGMHGIEFFLIAEGGAAIEVGGAPVATLGPGDHFGEVAALDRGPRTASVRATTRLRCLTLPDGALAGFLQAHPRIAVNVLHASVRRFRDAATAR